MIEKEHIKEKINELTEFVSKLFSDQIKHACISIQSDYRNEDQCHVIINLELEGNKKS